MKKLANWSWNNSFFFYLLPLYADIYNETPVFLKRKQGFFDRLKRDTLCPAFSFGFSCNCPCFLLS